MTNARIVICTDDSVEGGVSVYVHALACGLARAGCQVTCVRSKFDSPLFELQRKLGVHHYWLPFDTKKEAWRTVINSTDAEEAFAATKPGVVLFANCSVWSHVAAKSTAAQLGIPYVVVENYANENFAGQYKELLPFLDFQYRHARAVIAVSQENLELLRQFYKLNHTKGKVIHYGRPNSYFEPPSSDTRVRLRRELQIPQHAILCLTVGRLDEIKGYHLILQALRVLVSNPIHTELFFAWLGTGPLETQLNEEIRQIGFADHVKLLGHRQDVADILDASDIFLLPSFCEGMPLSIMEAMAKRLPVMATAVSGIPEELGDTGKLLTSPHVNSIATVNEIVDTLQQWAADDKLRASIGAACHARASVMFREERMIEETQMVIEDALRPTPDASPSQFPPPSERMLICYKPSPNMGLCNRLKGILSAMRIAQRFKWDYALHWPISYPEMTCCFTDLFEPLPEVETPVGDYGYVSWRFWVQEAELPDGWARAYPSEDVQGQAIDWEYHRIPEQFKAEYLALLEKLRPLPSLLSKANAIMPDRAVGVHYRDGADWHDWGRSTPIEQFWTVMDAFPSDTRFFVSTHTPASLEIMKNRYGSRIIHQVDKDYDGLTVKKMQDSLVDLLCLSQCSELIGTYGSSFSEMAWWFGRCKQPVHIVGKMTPAWRVT